MVEPGLLEVNATVAEEGRTLEEGAVRFDAMEDFRRAVPASRRAAYSPTASPAVNASVSSFPMCEGPGR